MYSSRLCSVRLCILNLLQHKIASANPTAMSITTSAFMLFHLMCSSILYADWRYSKQRKHIKDKVTRKMLNTFHSWSLRNNGSKKIPNFHTRAISRATNILLHSTFTAYICTHTRTHTTYRIARNLTVTKP